MRGQLRNRLGVLQGDLSGSGGALQRFLAELPGALPAAARLERLQSRWLPAPVPPWPEGVVIAADRPGPLGESLVAPGLSADRAPCPQCLAELFDPRSRRHRHPFISCCACGPRYSVATALPFCRAHTTYAAFPPCPACAAEFSDPADRRFHAETLTCPACGPRLRWLGPSGELRAEGEAALEEACRLVREGRILALQGVAGSQLLVDARQGEAVARLHRRKRRPSKPFAVLVADPWSLAGVVEVSAAEERALRHPAAPIVLLRRRFRAAARAAAGDAGAEAATELIAPGSPSLGVMLPASGLHHLLARALDRPLVATSGNRGGEPLCHTPEEAVERLAGLADGFLTHTLAIARPLDDSLLQVVAGRPALLRRARGFVPEPLPWIGPLPPTPTRATDAPPAEPSPPAEPPCPAEAPRPAESPRLAEAPVADPEAPGSRVAASRSAVLAVGGEWKAAPGLVVGDRLWLAPHLGDLAEAAVQRRWQALLAAHLTPSALDALDAPADALLDAPLEGVPEGPQGGEPGGERPPLRLACDAHPGYGSQHWTRALAERHRLPLTTVPHHLAHGLAVLAERGEQPPLLVVACDGLGLADPATAGEGERLWGGELLWIEGLAAAGLRWQRLAALRPFPLPGGDRASREPRRCALGLLTALGPEALTHPGAATTLQAFSPGERALLRAAIASGCNAPLTSSLGRFLDGVTSLLGLAQTLSHEGEGGLRWQGAAARWGLARGGGAGPNVEGRQARRPWRLPLRPARPGEAGAPPLGRWDWEPLLWALLHHRAAGGSAEEAAWRVERALVRGIMRGAGAATRWTGCRRVALTGGGFQNRSLLEASVAGLRRGGLEPLWAERVPANDGGLALGQAWAVQVSERDV